MSEVPSGWAWLNLGSVAARTINISPAKTPREMFELYSVPSYSRGQPEYLAGSEIKSAKQIVREGDVLLCKIVPHLNRVWTVSRKADLQQIASGEWIVYRDHECDSTYLRYCLSEADFRERFMTTVAGVGGSLLRARPSGVNKLHIPIAPLPEQRRIVAKIDSLTAKSARARDNLDHIPRLVEKYKQTVVSAALRGDLTKDWRDAQAGLKAWQRTLIENLIDWSSGKNLTSNKQSGGAIPVIGGNGISGYHDEALISHDTVVVGRVGAQCGNVHFSTGPAWITDNAIYAKTISDRLDPQFAVILLHTKNLNSLAGGTGQPYVNQTILNAVEFDLPSMPEQQEIIRRVKAASGRIDLLAKEATSARKLVDHLDQAVLAKAFRGELVPQDPNDEPASVLLERINAHRGHAAPEWRQKLPQRVGSHL